MYKNILIPLALDHDHDTAGAMDIAHRLLAEGGKMTALHVLEALPSYAAQYMTDEQLDQRHHQAAAALKAEIGALGDVRPVVITGHSGRSIVDYAAENSVDLIVVASHRPGLQDYLLGSTAARVVRHAPCAVHVVR